MFWSQYAKFDPVHNAKSDGRINEHVKVPVDLDPRAMLDHVLEALAELDILSKPPPPSSARDAALEDALGYSPRVRKEMSTPPSSRAKKAKGPRYYGISLAVDLSTLLPSSPTDWSYPGPISVAPHLTLVHTAELEARRAVWDAAAAQAQAEREVVVILGPMLVVVAGHVASLEARYEPGDAVEGVDAAAMHVTVATGVAVKPVEGKRAVEAWRRGETRLGDRDLVAIDVGVHRARGKVEGLH
jgi:hypothetical protein